MNILMNLCERVCEVRPKMVELSITLEKGRLFDAIWHPDQMTSCDKHYLYINKSIDSIHKRTRELKIYCLPALKQYRVTCLFNSNRTKVKTRKIVADIVQLTIW